MKNLEIENKANEIFNKMIFDVSKIFYIQEFSLNDFISCLNNIDNNAKESIFEKLINDQLCSLEKNVTIDNYNHFKKRIEDATDYFDDCSDEICIAESVATKLFLQLVKPNNNSIRIPIKVSDIRNYFDYKITDDNFYKSLTWILLKLVSIRYCLEYLESDVQKNK